MAFIFHQLDLGRAILSVMPIVDLSSMKTEESHPLRSMPHLNDAMKGTMEKRRSCTKDHRYQSHLIDQ